MKKILSVSMAILMILLCAGCLSISRKTTAEHEETENTHRPTAAPTAEPTAPPAAGITLETYNGGFFTVQLPAGWMISTAGQYASFGFRAWDPANPDYQIFYYGKFDPLLKSNAAKQYYMDTSAALGPGNAYAMFADAPAIDPTTVESFFYLFNDWAAFANKYGIVHQFSLLQNLGISDVIPYSTYFAPYATDEGLVLGSFESEQGTACTGQFGASIVSSGTYIIAPNIDTSPLAVYNINGVMAPSEDFDAMRQVLTEAVFSLRFSQAYANEASAVIAAGTADALIMNAELQAVFDIANAAWDDYIRG